MELTSRVLNENFLLKQNVPIQRIKFFFFFLTLPQKPHRLIPRDTLTVKKKFNLFLIFLFKFLANNAWKVKFVINNFNKVYRKGK